MRKLINFVASFDFDALANRHNEAGDFLLMHKPSGKYVIKAPAVPILDYFRPPKFDFTDDKAKATKFKNNVAVRIIAGTALSEDSPVEIFEAIKV